jgi:hypothetical protein
MKLIAYTYGTRKTGAPQQLVIMNGTRKFFPDVIAARDVSFMMCDLGVKWAEPLTVGAWLTYDYDGERHHIRWSGEDWETVSRRSVP